MQSILHLRSEWDLLEVTGVSGGSADQLRDRVATEVPDDKKVEILRAYLNRWKAEVGIFFDGVSGSAPDSDLRRIAPNHPVFRLTP